ncbi:MAG: UDP-N-acetylmuramoyl-L-alanine--D-glutamate ligase [Defluviitaleaceae bacterium]|nr:UDP-N-acetylmuramoyl-L-alanine--D-glutamate ligase [Defluviitaleaceae bacterium]
MDFKGMNILVCGMALSGVSAALLLFEKGANVTLQDIKPADKLEKELEMLANTNIDIYLGKDPDDIVSRFELIIVSPGLPLDLPFVDIANKLNIPIWSEVELAYRCCKCSIIAITGTNGKTTTTALTGEIMKAYRSGTEIVGNIGLPFSDKVKKLKAQDFAVVETSSFQLEACHDFKPFASAVLNISPDHLDRHKTMENYIAMKKSIFKNQDSGSYTVLNYDDPVTRKMAEEAKSKVIFFSASSELQNGVYVDSSGYIRIRTEKMDYRIIKSDELLILGRHNLENALAAVALASVCGAPPDIIGNVLKNFRGVQHRLEYVTEKSSIQFYNDSKATNPDSAIKGLLAMNRPTLLIAGGFDKKSDFNDWVKLFEGRVKFVAILGEVKEQIADTLAAHNFLNYEIVNSIEDAAKLCYEKASKGDAILLSPACASWDMFKSFEHRGDAFKNCVLDL